MQIRDLLRQPGNPGFLQLQLADGDLRARTEQRGALDGDAQLLYFGQQSLHNALIGFGRLREG